MYTHNLAQVMLALLIPIGFVEQDEGKEEQSHEPRKRTIPKRKPQTEKNEPIVLDLLLDTKALKPPPHVVHPQANHNCFFVTTRKLGFLGENPPNLGQVEEFAR